MENKYIITPSGNLVAVGELSHAGIKGMRWGVRRYQNKDGSLTDLGKRRYNREADKGNYDQRKDDGTRFKQNKKGKVEALKVDADKWVNEDLQNVKKVTDDSAQLATKLKTINDKSIKNQPKTRLDLSKMSDKELRDQINREMLERQYNDVFNPPTVSKGKETAGKILETTGDVLLVAGSAVSLALGIRALMGKG